MSRIGRIAWPTAIVGKLTCHPSRQSGDSRERSWKLANEKARVKSANLACSKCGIGPLVGNVTICANEMNDLSTDIDDTLE